MQNRKNRKTLAILRINGLRLFHPVDINNISGRQSNIYDLAAFGGNDKLFVI